MDTKIVIQDYKECCRIENGGTIGGAGWDGDFGPDISQKDKVGFLNREWSWGTLDDIIFGIRRMVHYLLTYLLTKLP